MPAILATQEMEIRMIEVWGQPGPQTSRPYLKDPISKVLNTKKGWQSGSTDREPAYQV
jgi:hypothetical protein